MTIEEFEIEVRNIFIAKGWDTEEPNWFNIGIISRYKDKTVMITTITGQILVTCSSENFSGTFGAFENCLSELMNK